MASARNLVVGGGPAGAAAAIHLARAGAPVTLIERTTAAHDKVCGDFLGGTALAALAGLGIDVGALGGAPIGRVRLIAGERVAEAALPFAAFGLSRRVLDQALLDRAEAAGALVRRGEALRSLADFGSRTVLLATGKHDLRETPRPGRRRSAVGLKTYVALAPEQAEALAGTVELVLLEDGYAGLQPVEAGRAVLCVMRRRESLRGGDQHHILDDLAAASAHLRHRLRGAAAAPGRTVAVAGIPYGHLHEAVPADPPTLFRLGDQAAVIPSFAGEGIAIALFSAALAARCVLAGETSISYHHKLQTRLRSPMMVAMAAHRLACAPGAQAWMVRACRLCPSIIGFTATRTRC